MKRKKTGFTPLEMIISNRAGNEGSKRFLTGFTTVELLTVLAIISMLVGLLIPAVSMVKSIAREVKQSAQLTTMGMALEAFKNDYGDYPPSDYPLGDYCGAQKLAEALCGWDLLGFHPDSGWLADGKNARPYRDVAGVVHPPGTYFLYNPTSDYDMDKRKGPYLELATANVFKLGALFFPNGTSPLNGDRYVICDAFGVKSVNVIGGKAFKAGTPILYYKANVSSKQMIYNPSGITSFKDNIYNVQDNGILVGLGKVKDRTVHKLLDPAVFYSTDGGVLDPKVTSRPWPYRPDSYILISAGADGEYGTGDDITNF